VLENEKEDADGKKGGDEDEEDEDEDDERRWDTNWIDGMKSYSEQLQMWQQLQDYDTRAEREMVTKSDYKLGVYNDDY